jgi:hypothetical protein
MIPAREDKQHGLPGYEYEGMGNRSSAKSHYHIMIPGRRGMVRNPQAIYTYNRHNYTEYTHIPHIRRLYIRTPTW